MLKFCPVQKSDATTTTSTTITPTANITMETPCIIPCSRRKRRTLDIEDTYFQQNKTDKSSYTYTTPYSKNTYCQCQLEHTTNGYKVSILKHIPRETLLSAIDAKLTELKQQSYTPTYTIVQDNLGNQLCLEDKINEEELLESCLSRLDLLQIRRDVARKLFREHQFKWMVNGNLVRLFSKRDKFVRLFQLEDGIDVRNGTRVEYTVNECCEEQRCDIATCTITIKNVRPCDIQECKVEPEEEEELEELFTCQDYLLVEEVRRLQRERASTSNCNFKGRCSQKRCCRRAG